VGGLGSIIENPVREMNQSSFRDIFKELVYRTANLPRITYSPSAVFLALIRIKRRLGFLLD